VVGGEVGGWVGRLALPARTPVAEHGAVVGDDPTPALSLLGIVVEVRGGVLSWPGRGCAGSRGSRCCL
jgi:hypothetical protein